MKFQWTVALGLSAVCAVASPTLAQHVGSAPNHYAAPTLLPLPQVSPQWNATASYPQTATPYAEQSANYRPTYPAYAQLQPPAPPEASSPSDAPHPQPAYGDLGAPLGPDPYGAAMCGNSWGGECAVDLPTACGPTWFGGAYALIMSRDDSNHLCFSYDTNDLNYQPLTSRSIDWEWQGGVEARFGRMFGCCYGVEDVWWGIFDNSQSAQVWAADVDGDLGTSLAFNDLNFGADNVTDWTDGAETYRLKRNYSAQNVELNLIRFGMLGDPCGGVQCCGPYGQAGCGSGLCLSGTVGVRFFRFEEGFNFESSENGDWNDPNQTLGYAVDVENSLVGVQLGGRADYNHNRWSLFSDVKFGLFGNYMEGSQYVVDGHGSYATINNGPNSGTAWNYDSSKTDVSFLGEVRLGGAYQISPCWRATAAYRAVAISGVALSTEQVPTNFGDYYGARALDSNGSLILHGVQLGVECAF